MNHNEWLEKAEIYALSALDGEELTVFEAHLASGCALCEDRLREVRESLTQIPQSLIPLAPPPAVRSKLLQKIASEAIVPAQRRPQLRWLWWGIGAGALAAVGLLISLSWNLSTAQQELQRLQGQMAALQVEVAKQQELVDFLSNPKARFIQLAGLGPSPGATGRLLWDPVSRKGLLLTAGLPELPAGQEYELWAITGDEPVPAGVFKVGGAGRALFRLPPLPEAKTFDKFAVTLEPAGGVSKPTGPMHLLGGI